MALQPVLPSPIARRLFWHVLALGSGTVSKESKEKNFAKAGGQIVWIKSGRGKFYLDPNTFQLRPGPFFWLFSTRRRRSWFTDNSFVVSSIRFGGPTLEAWLEEMDAARRPELHVSNPAFIYRAQKKLLRLVKQQPANWELKVHLILSAMLGQLLLTRKTLSPTDASLPAPIVRVFDAVTIDPDRAWKATELAPIAGVSYSHLRQLFRDTIHESIHDYLQQKRLDRARLLLTERKLGIKEIAEKLQFGSEFYFSRFFKSHTGVNPSHFRKHSGISAAPVR